MISKIAIAGYRSLRDVILPFGPLTVVTGANGSGKSSVYRALRLMAGIADDRIIASLAREGGFESVRWAGPERISREMRAGTAPVQGTRRKEPVSLKLGFENDGVSYSIELGLPVSDSTSMFGGDPEIKREVLWFGDSPTPSRIIADRRRAGVHIRGEGGKPVQSGVPIRAYESIVRNVTRREAPSEVEQLRAGLSAWRFYDHFRTDDEAPARRRQVGTRTTVLAPDGADLAAAIQTIREIGDREALAAAMDAAFPGSRLEVEVAGGLFDLRMRQTGMLRPIGVRELSDGTLRFILLAAALLAPRPSPLLVLNEPEASLHGDLVPALASLIGRASQDSQVVVVSHNRALVAALLGLDAELIELRKDMGETMVTASERPRWTWPTR